MTQGRITYVVMSNRLMGAMWGALGFSLGQRGKWWLVGLSVVFAAVAGVFHAKAEYIR